LIFYRKSLEILKEKYGDDHLKIATCLINTAVIYVVKEKHQGINHSDIPILYNNIGLVHQHLYQFDLALENFHRALNIHQTLPEEQNREYAIALENIGCVYKRIKQWKDAVNYLEEAISIIVIYCYLNIRRSLNLRKLFDTFRF